MAVDVHLVTRDVVYLHGCRQRSAPVRSGASQFDLLASDVVGCDIFVKPIIFLNFMTEYRYQLLETKEDISKITR